MTPELPKRWKATHIVTPRDGPELQVMLTPNIAGYSMYAAYTRAEWAVRRQSGHYTGLRCISGQWFFHQKTFTGKVRVV